MGLIQELTRYLEQKNDIKSYEDKIEELRLELCNANEKLAIATAHKEYAIDEIGLLQKRVDSLLRQLRDKNGGN